MKSNKKNHKKTLDNKNNFWIIPSILALALIPLIVKGYEYNPHLLRFSWYTDKRSYIDIFMYWKNFFIGFTAVVMAGLLLLKSIKTKNYPVLQKEFSLMAVYLLMVILSAVFCKYKEIMLNGTIQWFETVWVYIGVVIMMYYTLSSVNSEKDVIKTFEYATIGISCVYFIGLLQLCGVDPFKYDFFKNLVLTSKQRAEGIKLSLNFPDRTVYSTLNNPDYVSLYAGPLFFIFVSLSIYNKKLWKRIIFGLLALISLILQKGSTTLTGFVAIAVTVYFVFLVYSGQTKKKRIISWSITGILVICTVLFLILSPAENKIKQEFLGTYKISDVYKITDVKTTKNSAIFYSKKDELHIVFDNESLLLTNKAGEPIGVKPVNVELGEYQFSDTEMFGEVYITYSQFITPENEEFYGCTVTICDRDWPFAITDENEVRYLNNENKWVKLKKRGEIVNLFNDNAMSNRGYQWNRIIPILKRTLFIGTGPCTYVTAYPQEDYIVRSFYNIRNTIDVKGHSWFLTSAVEIGVLAVIMLIAFYIIYVIKALKHFYKAEGSTKWLILGILASTFCYMVGCLANDSTVNTSVVFWIILGLGIGLNIVLDKEQ